MHSGLLYAQQDRRALQAHVECVEDTQALRDQLPALGLVAFVGDGAILPRCALHTAVLRTTWAASARGPTLPPAAPSCPLCASAGTQRHSCVPGCRKSGACDEPMPAGEAVPFRSPDALAATVQLPNRGAVRGLGIRRARLLGCRACWLLGCLACWHSVSLVVPWLCTRPHPVLCRAVQAWSNAHCGWRLPWCAPHALTCMPGQRHMHACCRPCFRLGPALLTRLVVPCTCRQVHAAGGDRSGGV